MTFQAAVQALIDTAMAQDRPVTWEELQHTGSHVVQDGASADNAARNQAMERFKSVITETSPGRAAMVALVCGALVEQGADPTIAAPAIATRAAGILRDAAAFVRACQDAAGSAVDAESAIQQQGQNIAPTMELQASAFGALDILYRPFVALLSRSSAARQAAKRDSALTGALRDFPGEIGGVGWMRQLMQVLDDEELMVLHPEHQRGYRVKISGVAGNHQLYTLLEDSLIGDPAQGWLPGKRPSPQVVEAARHYVADSPPVTGAFNLYNWQALQPNGTLPTGMAASTHWIWIEGIPADIAPFEGTRVVLLSPPPYARSWTMSVPFAALEAAVQVMEQLSLAAVQDWLERIARAPRN